MVLCILIANFEALWKIVYIGIRFIGPHVTLSCFTIHVTLLITDRD